MKYPQAHRDAVVEAVITFVANGLSTRKACALAGADMASFLNWVRANPESLKRYEESCAMLYRHWAEDILEIADTPEAGVIRKITERGIETTTKDMTDHRRLRIDSRRWLLSKLLPSTYGDKQQIGGAADLPPIRSESTVSMSPDEAYRAMCGVKPK